VRGEEDVCGYEGSLSGQSRSEDYLWTSELTVLRPAKDGRLREAARGVALRNATREGDSDAPEQLADPQRACVVYPLAIDTAWT
jgi:hypothetical protein